MAKADCKNFRNSANRRGCAITKAGALNGRNTVQDVKPFKFDKEASLRL